MNKPANLIAAAMSPDWLDLSPLFDIAKVAQLGFAQAQSQTLARHGIFDAVKPSVKYLGGFDLVHGLIVFVRIRLRKFLTIAL